MKSFQVFFGLFIVLSMMTLSDAFACQKDLDCNLGSKCQKAQNAMYGVCVGGINPGNSHDKNPAKFLGDLTGKFGNTCSFDLDCGIGNECRKQRVGDINGVCAPQ